MAPLGRPSLGMITPILSWPKFALKIVLDNVQKTYGKRQVVNRVSLSVAQGEIVGLLGPNGAGKTTTFYMATGLERPDSGKVCLDQIDITDLPMHERARLGIGYLAQEPSIFRNLSVADNIRLVLQQTRVPAEDHGDRLRDLLKEFRLEKVANTLGIQVSGRTAADRTGPIPSLWPGRPKVFVSG